MRTFATIITSLLLLLASLGSAVAAPAPAEKLSTVVSPAGQNGYDPQVAVSPGGAVVVAAWILSQSPEGRIQTAQRPVDGTWSRPSTVSDADASEPQVAVDQRGDATVVWTLETAGHTRIQAIDRPAGGTWTSPTTLSSPDGDAHAPQVAVDAQGAVTVVWTLDNGTRTLVQTSSHPSGGSWTTPQSISLAGQDTTSPQVAMDATGNATAVWVGAGVVQTTYRPAKGIWTKPQALSAAGGTAASGPQVAVNPRGDATAVWSLEDDATGRVQATHRRAGATWGSARTLGTGRLGSPAQVAVDRAGRSTTVWAQAIDSSDTHSQHRVVAVRSTVSGRWAAPHVFQPDTATSDYRSRDDSMDPAVTVGPDDTATVVWAELLPYDGEGPLGTITAALARPGAPWTNPVDVARGMPETPQVAVDRSGVATTLWLYPYYGGGEGADHRYSEVTATRFDTAGPAVTMKAPDNAYQKYTTFSTAWRVTSLWPGHITTDLRYRSANWNANFGAHKLRRHRATIAGAPFRGHPGRTYCFSTRGHGSLDNQSAWSPEHCTTIAIDDRTAKATRSWTEKKHAGYYRSSYRRSSHHGATLTLKHVKARRLALLVATGPHNGTVRVTYKGANLGTYLLTSAKNQRRRIIPVKTFRQHRTGTLKVRVVSRTGRAVRIDGIYAGR